MWEQDRSPSVQQSLSLVLNTVIAPGGVTRGVAYLEERYTLYRWLQVIFKKTVVIVYNAMH